MGTIPDSTCLVVLYERLSGTMYILLSSRTLMQRVTKRARSRTRVVRASASHDGIDRGL